MGSELRLVVAVVGNLLEHAHESWKKLERTLEAEQEYFLEAAKMKEDTYHKALDICN